MAAAQGALGLTNEGEGEDADLLVDAADLEPGDDPMLQPRRRGRAPGPRVSCGNARHGWGSAII